MEPEAKTWLFANGAREHRWTLMPGAQFSLLPTVLVLDSDSRWDVKKPRGEEVAFGDGERTTDNGQRANR